MVRMRLLEVINVAAVDRTLQINDRPMGDDQLKIKM